MDKLECTQPTHSVEECRRQQLQSLQQQIRELEGKCEEYARLKGERDQLQLQCNHYEQELAKKKEGEVYYQKNEERMKKQLQLINQQLKCYNENMKQLKTQMEKDQLLMAKTEDNLHSLREEMREFLQLKNILCDCCESILTRMKACADIFGVYPEFYQLQIVVNQLSSIIKESDSMQELNTIPVQSCDEAIVFYEEKTLEGVVNDQEIIHQYNEAVRLYSSLYKQLVNEQYELVVVEEGIRRCLFELNQLHKMKQYREFQMEELKALITRFYEEILILSEEVKKEEESVFVINRISTIESMLQKRKQQYSSFEKEYQSIVTLFATKRTVLEQLILKKEAKQHQVEETKCSLKRKEDEVCVLRVSE